MTEEDIDVARVRDAVSKLGEHFDSVQVFTTRHDPGEEKHTISIQLGSGNWYSRYGQVKSWVIKCDEDTRIETRKADEE